MSNITQVVNSNKYTTTMSKGVNATGLDQLLSSQGPFTLFAPSDLAFTKLEPGTFEKLLKPDNKTELTSILNHHVVAGKIDFKDLKHGDMLKTLDGKELSVRVMDGKVTIDGANIQNRDLPSSNGVIHMLDTVLNN